MRNYTLTMAFKSFFLLSVFFVNFSNAQEIVWSKPQNQNAISKFGTTYKLVNDFEKILTVDETIKLTKEIEKINQKGNFKITIVTIEDFSPYNSITSMGRDLHSYWKVGHDKKGDGVLIIFSKNKRSVSIVNTMEKIPHHEIQSIINNVMIPSFGKKDFYNGLLFGVLKCVEIKSKYVG